MSSVQQLQSAATPWKNERLRPGPCGFTMKETSAVQLRAKVRKQAISKSSESWPKDEPKALWSKVRVQKLRQLVCMGTASEFADLVYVLRWLRQIPWSEEH